MESLDSFWRSHAGPVAPIGGDSQGGRSGANPAIAAAGSAGAQRGPVARPDRLECIPSWLPVTATSDRPTVQRAMNGTSASYLALRGPRLKGCIDECQAYPLAIPACRCLVVRASMNPRMLPRMSAGRGSIKEQGRDHCTENSPVPCSEAYAGSGKPHGSRYCLVKSMSASGSSMNFSPSGSKLRTRPVR